MRSVAWALCVAMLAAGCKSGGDGGGGSKAPARAKRPPRTATLYVESKGEPVNAGGKTVEVADASGKPKGSFGAKDLLVPGMTLLVTGATVAGGALLVKALDKKDRPAGPMVVAGGGSEGTYVPVPLEKPASAAAPAEVAPDPAAFSGVATEGAEATVAVASGTGVVSTPSEVLMTMGYAADFSGPSYIKMKGSYSGSLWQGKLFVQVYTWELTLDRSAVTSGETVDVFASFSGLADGNPVEVRLYVPPEAEFVVEHSPILTSIPPGATSLGDAWVVFGPEKTYDISGTFLGNATTVILTAPTGGTPVKLGHLVVSAPVEVTGDSSIARLK